jgi:hypothetical protein
MRSIQKLSAVTLCLTFILNASITAQADVRIKLRTTFSHGGGFDSILYLKGKRQREEMSHYPSDAKSFSVAYLNFCDLKQFVWLDLQNKRYALQTGGIPLGVAMAFNEPQVQINQQLVEKARARAKGLLTEVTTVTDTGERREMFGFTARHLKTVTVWEPQPRHCDGPDLKREVDGWYIDLLYGIDCSPDLSGTITRGYSIEGKCFTEYLFKRNYFLDHKRHGPSVTGYPLIEETTWITGKGGGSTTRTEVLELSTDELSPGLFEVPSEFAKMEMQRYHPSLFDRVRSILGKR